MVFSGKLPGALGGRGPRAPTNQRRLRCLPLTQVTVGSVVGLDVILARAWYFTAEETQGPQESSAGT